MSGHNNPHGRGPQNSASSWNAALPVPSYIPRQPQLAHMSNDRPLTWHTPTPPEALYPFIAAAAANQKNPLDINPLLPPFGRTPSFGTMDLSVPSAARNNSTPTPRNLNSPPPPLPGLNNNCIGSNSHTLAPPPPLGPDFSNKGGNLNRNPSPGVIQPNPLAKDKSLNAACPTNGDLMPPCPSSSGLYVRDAKQINNDLVKLVREPIGLPLMSEPVELVKEAIFQVNNRTRSQAHGSEELSKSPVNTTKISPNPMETSSSNLNLLPPPEPHNINNNNSNLTSNDESVELNDKEALVGGRKRRKRKPNKTSRMSNESSDDLVNGNNSEENVPLVVEKEQSIEKERSSPNKESQELNQAEENVVQKELNSPNKRAPKNLDETINKKRRSRRSKGEDSSPTDADLMDIFAGTNLKEDLQNDDPKLNPESSKQEQIQAILEPQPPPKPLLNSTAKEVDHDTSFEDVENKLEEMFAGIEDDEERKRDSITPKPVKKRSKGALKENGLNEEEEEEFQNGPKKKRKSSAKKPGTQIKNKKKPSKNGKGSKFKKPFPEDEFTVPKKVTKEVVVEEPKYRGPYVQVKQLGGLVVINAPQQQLEDDPDKQNSIKVKKFHVGGHAERSKIRGLHVSTLSTKYDAETTDASWMCVFCKLGPHKMGLGDLFGPYVVTTTCDEFGLSKLDPALDEFKSKRTKKGMVQKAPHCMPIVPAGVKSPEVKAPKKGKKKDKLDAAAAALEDARLFYGMTKVSDTTYEIWLHEDCMIWAPGVNMIAGRLLGLENAVWSTTKNQCGLCEKNGATVFCLERGCSGLVHFFCARQSSWSLCDGELKCYCPKHSKEPRVVDMVAVASSSGAKPSSDL